MVSILLADVYIVGVEDWRARGPGYVYVADNSVKRVGLGEPPEDLQYADLFIAGEARIVMPGLLLPPVMLEAYPLRGLLRPEDALPLIRGDHKVSRIVARMSWDEAYYAALMMLYEASLNGYTAVIALTPSPDPVKKAIEDAGLYGMVISLSECWNTGEWEARGSSRVKVDVLACEGKGEGRVSLGGDGAISYNGRKMFKLPPWRREIIPAPGIPNLASPWLHLAGATGLEAEEVFGQLTIEAYRIIEEDYEPYKSDANIIVVDVSEPPSWLPSPEAFTPRHLAPTRPRIETLLSQGRIVVDHEHHMYIGRELARKASQILQQLKEH